MCLLFLDVWWWAGNRWVLLIRLRLAGLLLRVLRLDCVWGDLFCVRRRYFWERRILLDRRGLGLSFLLRMIRCGRLTMARLWLLLLLVRSLMNLCSRFVLRVMSSLLRLLRRILCVLMLRAVVRRLCVRRRWFCWRLTRRVVILVAMR